MPSKPLMIVILLVAGGGVWGLLQLGVLHRDVPLLPADLPLPGTAFAPPSGSPAGTDVAAGEAPGPGEPAGEGTEPAEAEKPAEPAPPPVEDAGDAVRIRDLALQPIQGRATEPVSDPGDTSFAVLRIHADGKARFSALELSGVDGLTRMLADAAEGLQIVIAPDKGASWDHVRQALEIAREAGVLNVALGVAPTTDRERTLLAMIRAPLLPAGAEPELPEGVLEVPVLVAADGYTVLEEKAAGPPDVHRIATRHHTDFVEFNTDAYDDDPRTTPWVVRPEAGAPAGRVLQALEALKLAGVDRFRLE